MPRDKQVCRFCLDSHNKKRNPLIRPCDCRGSVAFVHVLCLQQWQMIDYERNSTTCGLCLTDYTETGNPYLEDIPNDSGYTVFFLRYPFLGGIFVHYIWLTHASYGQTTVINHHYHPLYIQYQIAFQLLYFFLFARNLNVRHLDQYKKAWLRLSGLLLIFTHAIGFFGLFYESFLSGLFLNFILGFYWQRHHIILRDINDTLLEE